MVACGLGLDEEYLVDLFGAEQQGQKSRQEIDNGMNESKIDCCLAATADCWNQAHIYH